MKRKMLFLYTVIFILILSSSNSLALTEQEYITELTISSDVIGIIMDDIPEDISDYGNGLITKDAILLRLDNLAIELELEYTLMSSLDVPSTCRNMHSHYLLSINYLRLGCLNTIDGITNNDVSYIEAATDYFNLASDEINIVNDELTEFTQSTDDSNWILISVGLATFGIILIVIVLMKNKPVRKNITVKYAKQSQITDDDNENEK